MRILLIEDEPAMARTIELLLSAEGFEARSANSGEQGLQHALDERFDIILLDLTLPDMTGQELLNRLRAAEVATPVLVLSGLADLASKIRALSAGADDYLTKPFHRNELMARIHAVVRRSTGHLPAIITIGSLEVNIDANCASVRGERLPLTGKEYAILELLAQRQGQTITKDSFLSQLYGGMDEPEFKIIDVFVCKLRKKLSMAGSGVPQITTVWGQGYALHEAESLPLAA